MSSNGNRGGRRLRVALASAIAAFGVGAVGVSSASADTIILDHGFLKISGLEAPTEVVTPAAPVTLTTDAALPGTFTIDNDPDINDIQDIVPTGHGDRRYVHDHREHRRRRTADDGRASVQRSAPQWRERGGRG